MNIKGLIKNILINEVGEGSHRPFRTKRAVLTYQNKYQSSKERDDFNYEFKTENGYKYSVTIARQMGQKQPHGWWALDQDTHNKEELATFYNRDRGVYVNLRKLGASREDFLNMWNISFQVEDAPDEFYEKKEQKEDEDEKEGNLEGLGMDNSEETSTSNHPGWWEMPTYGDRLRYITSSDDMNHGEFFRVMATVSKIIKDHVKKYKGKVITFSPADERRGRIFTRYILTQIPGTKSYVNNNDFYFLINA